jgi:hypothetical protein
MTDRTRVCSWCEAGFYAPTKKGPRPNYCSDGHRQREFEQKIRSRSDRVRDLAVLAQLYLDRAAEYSECCDGPVDPSSEAMVHASQDFVNATGLLSISTSIEIYDVAQLVVRLAGP